MEPDGITRLYYYHDSPSIRVVEACPDNTKWQSQSWTTGQQATEIYNRAEFVCVSIIFGDGFKRKNKTIWSVHPKGEQPKKWFEVWRSRPYSDEDYKDLIRKLEKRTHKKGLTVLVS